MATDSRVQVQAMLKKLGIPGLFDMLFDAANEQIINLDNEDSIALYIRETDEYKSRFAGNEVRRKKGLPDLSPSRYIAIEDSYKNSLKVNGIPNDFYDTPEEMAQLIGGDVDVQEFNDRLQVASSIAQNASPEVLKQLTSMYGITSGQLTAYFLDPEKMLPVLKEQERAARIGAAAVESGGMSIDKATAEDLAKRRITDSQAITGFGNIAQLGEMTQTAGNEESISSQSFIGSQFGYDPEATKKITNRKARRLAEFQGGGNFARNQDVGAAINSSVGSAG